MKESTLDKLIEKSSVNALKCSSCGKLHDINSNISFFTIYGNICKGLTGGLIGNNLDENGRVNRVSILCSDNCMDSILKQ